jgi:hypothetical protein
VLVPARIDDAEVPLGFRGLQTADLSGWKGDEDGPALRPIVTAVAALLASQDSASGQGETRAGSRSTSSEAAGGTAAPPPRPDVPQQRRVRPLEGLLGAP